MSRINGLSDEEFKNIIKRAVKEANEEQAKIMKASFPCPHGRQPIGDDDGWRHCPWCLGINKSK